MEKLPLREKMRINNMKYRFAAIIVVSSLLLTACSGKDRSGEMPTSVTETTSTAEETTEEITEETTIDPNAEPESGALPVFSLSNTEGAAGETVDVTVSLSGANEMWAMCGIHFAYPSALTIEMMSGDEKRPSFTRGTALNYISSFDTMIWTDNLSDELIANNEYSVFFAAISTDNTGMDGDIVTYRFTIPEDAEPGTVYELRFFDISGDMFYDIDNDPVMQSYAFNHWQNGSITVK
jgi:hypothetical protein